MSSDILNIQPKLNNLAANNFIFDKIYDKDPLGEGEQAQAGITYLNGNDDVYINRYALVKDGYKVYQKTGLGRYTQVGRLTLPQMTFIPILNTNPNSTVSDSMELTKTPSDDPWNFQQYTLTISLPSVGNAVEEANTALATANEANEKLTTTQSSLDEMVDSANKAIININQALTEGLKIEAGNNITTTTTNGNTRISHQVFDTDSSTTTTVSELIASVSISNGHITGINTISTSNLTVGKAENAKNAIKADTAISASSAGKLYKSVNLSVDLTSTNTVTSFDGSKSVSIPIGTIPIEKGGTGVTNSTDTAQIKVASSTSADKLSTSRTITANLSTSSEGSFDGSADTTISVIGVLPVEKGGTGAESLNDVTVGTALVACDEDDDLHGFSLKRSESGSGIQRGYLGLSGDGSRIRWFNSEQAKIYKDSPAENKVTRGYVLGYFGDGSTFVLQDETQGTPHTIIKAVPESTNYEFHGISRATHFNSGTATVTFSQLTSTAQQGNLTDDQIAIIHNYSSAYPYTMSVVNAAITEDDSVDVYFDPSTLKSLKEGDFQICPSTYAVDGKFYLFSDTKDAKAKFDYIVHRYKKFSTT